MAVLLRALGDVAEPGSLVMLLLVVGGLGVLLQNVAFVDTLLYAVTGEGDLFSAFLSDLYANALPMLVYYAVLTFFTLVFIARIANLRGELDESPFSAARRSFLPAILLSLIVVAPFVFVTVLYFYLSHVPFVSTLLLATLMLLALVYLPSISFSLPALVIEGKGIARALREGLIAGKRLWWKYLLLVLVLGLLMSLLTYAVTLALVPVPALLPFAFLVLSVFWMFTPYALLTEMYLEDAR